jgi:hypothetical protein
VKWSGAKSDGMEGSVKNAIKQSGDDVRGSSVKLMYIGRFTYTSGTNGYGIHKGQSVQAGSYESLMKR